MMQHFGDGRRATTPRAEDDNDRLGDRHHALLKSRSPERYRMLAPFAGRGRGGQEAVDKYGDVEPDVLVRDTMLLDIDGLEILHRVRQSGRYTPTLFLTARDSVMDRVTGLTAGADDYMTKPFSLEELVARLRGLLRRSTQLTPPAAESLKIGDLHVDTASREVTRGGTQISLSSTEFELLRFLMRNPRRALSR